jgi:hypothetical protein
MTAEIIDERFTDSALNPALWVDPYLPQWTEPGRSRARLVGFEESSPADSGELCIAELFGDSVVATGLRA